MKAVPNQRSAPSQRRGAIVLLVAGMLFVFVVMAALTVDVAYMQLIRTDLRIATDAAALAGAEALARTEDIATARSAAKTAARRNTVGGQIFRIRNNDVQFGRVVENGIGGYDFDMTGTPANAVRVNGRLANGARTPARPLFFAPALGHDDFETQHFATASQQDVEVCFALDRSGSMGWDMSGVAWSYPYNNPLLISFTAWGWTWRNNLSPPHPTDSRWAILVDAIGIFMDEAGQHDLKPRIGMVTWAHNYTMPIAPGTFYPTAEVDVMVPAHGVQDWPTNLAAINAALAARSAEAVMGGTNLSGGLDLAVTQLTGPTMSSLSNKIIILLTDGQWNNGRDPLLAAADAQAANITVHCVSMNGGSTTTCQQIANTTGGQFHSANTQDQLRTAFRELARTLPIVLTE